MWRSASILLLAGLALPPPGVASAADRRSPVVRSVERVGPAVVNISTKQLIQRGQTPFRMFRDPFFDQFLHDFFDAPGEHVARTSLGSGVIIRADGYIITNQHVILRGAVVRVTLADEREFEATLVGTDSDSDLAVLKVDADAPLPTADLGNSDDLLIGETVVAIGNPFGLSHTVTTGVVSAVGRPVKTDEQTFYDFIQTDASINPGNSGGPLLNIDGQIIGINTAIYQGAQGIGFAIPINRAERIVDDLIRYGEVQLPWVGALVQDLTPDLIRHFGLPRGRGVLVREIEADSPAGNSGVAPGDIIVAVAGHPVRSSHEYRQRIRDRAPGSQIRLDVLRKGRKLTFDVPAGTFPSERAEALAWTHIGVRVRAVDGGLKVTKIRRGSAAHEIGIVPGDVLVGLAGTRIDSLERFRKKIVEIRSSRSVLLSIRRGRRVYHVTTRFGI